VRELASLAHVDGRRFRDGADWFVVAREAALVVVRVGTVAERVVDVWRALAAHLDPAVDVHIADVRTARVWQGALLALSDVRDAMGRLRGPLSAYGGVELSLFTDTDQLTITPELLLVIHARTDRWAFLLDGMGLTERPAMPAPTWVPSREALRPEPQLELVLQDTAERLRLAEITS